jgi:hypothetical protein
VDDNTIPDHDWWLSMAEKYDFKMTCVFNPADLLSTNSTGNWWWSYRGWQVMFWHYLQGTNDSIEVKTLMPLAASKDSIWVGRYDHVAMYGQQMK